MLGDALAPRLQDAGHLGADDARHPLRRQPRPRRRSNPMPSRLRRRAPDSPRDGSPANGCRRASPARDREIVIASVEQASRVQRTVGDRASTRPTPMRPMPPDRGPGRPRRSARARGSARTARQLGLSRLAGPAAMARPRGCPTREPPAPNATPDGQPHRSPHVAPPGTAPPSPLRSAHVASARSC